MWLIFDRIYKRFKKFLRRTSIIQPLKVSFKVPQQGINVYCSICNKMIHISSYPNYLTHQSLCLKGKI